MKKITLGFCAISFAAMTFVGCKKGTNTAPEQDMEFQSSKDVSYAVSLVTELEQIVAYAAERLNTAPVFVPAPGAAGTINCDLSDTLNKKITVVYTNSVLCRDGKKRNGSIVIDYSSGNIAQGGKFYRKPGFVAKVSLNGYWVDGWIIEDTQTFTVANVYKVGEFSNGMNLKWSMEGYMHLQYLQDTTKNMVWQGKMTKELLNTTTPAIYNATGNLPINWVVYVNGKPTNGAQLAYTGTVSGVTSRLISYKYEVDATKPEKALLRSLICSPDPVVGIATTPSIVPIYSEWHPFIAGVATFTSNGPNTTEQRVIDYGSGEPVGPCDNSGTVYIKGITYNIDFKK